MPNTTQGMNWIRQDKRLALYLRDGLACVWCGAAVEDGVKLTLDHVVCRTAGGTHHESNLVTCCHACNSRRGDRAAAEFAEAVAGYVNHGVTADEILSQIALLTAKPLAAFRREAREMVQRRGSAAKALASL